MKAWITTFLFSSGIIEAEYVSEQIVTDNLSHKVVDIKYELYDRFGYRYLLSREDFEFDYLLAIKKAEEMRQKKIESLKKQIKKLEEMRFE